MTLGVTLALVALVALGLVMDPLGYAGAAGWRPLKPTEAELALSSSGGWPVPHGTREAKLLNVKFYQPESVYFGSSTVWSYIDTGYPPLRWTDGRRAYNFGLAGVNIREMLASFEHTVALKPPRRIVVGLEFYMFAADKPDSPDFAGIPLANRPTYRRDLTMFVARHVLTADYISASAVLAWKALAGWFVARVHAAGLDAQALLTRDDFVRIMLDNDKVILTALYPYRDRPYRLIDDHGQSSIDAVRRMIALAREHDIDLRIYLSPNHARSFEAIRLLGWWPQFEQWQRGLAAAIDEDAKAHPGAAPIPLWDFCCYNSITMDPIVEPKGDNAGFKNFADQIHFKTQVGFLVMDRIFNTPAAATLPADFGVRIDGSNIDAHLADIARAHSAFEQSHREDIDAEVRALQALGRYPQAGGR